MVANHLKLCLFLVKYVLQLQKNCWWRLIYNWLNETSFRVFFNLILIPTVFGTPFQNRFHPFQQSPILIGLHDRCSLHSLLQFLSNTTQHWSYLCNASFSSWILLQYIFSLGVNKEGHLYKIQSGEIWVKVTCSCYYLFLFCHWCLHFVHAN